MTTSIKCSSDLTDSRLMRLVHDTTQLTSLDLGWCTQITDAGVAHLKELPQLTSLKLSGCEQITDAGLAHVKELTQLTELSLWGCNLITDTGPAHVKELTQLTELDLSCCRRITEAGVAHLKGITVLKKLDLGGCWSISDVGLAHVKELPQLTSLDLGSCKHITDAGLAHVKELPQLTSLKLSGCEQITDAGLAHVKELPQLTSLKLAYCNKITDEGLAHLKGMPQLTSLNLSFCNLITDTDLVHVREMPQLTSLDVSSCDKITDEGIAVLGSLTRLSSLRIWQCPPFTPLDLLRTLPLLRSSRRLSKDGNLLAGIICANEDETRWALNDGAHVNRKYAGDMTPLHFAARRNAANVALLLKDAMINAKTSNGETPLHIAAHHNAVNMVRVLVEKGADVKKTDARGRTPLHIAAQQNALEIVQVLIANGADMESTSYRCETPLHAAAMGDAAAAIRLLLEKGADATAKDLSNWTALDLAILRGSKEAAGVLVNARDASGDAPLHRAARAGDAEQVQRLIAAGASVNSKGKDGRTPLCLAVAAGLLPVVRHLIAGGANAQLADDAGTTAATVARARGFGHLAAFAEVSTAKVRLTLVEEVRSLAKAIETKRTLSLLYRHTPALREAYKIHSRFVLIGELSPKLSSATAVTDTAGKFASNIKCENVDQRDLSRVALMNMNEVITREHAALRELAKQALLRNAPHAASLPPYLGKWLRHATTRLAEWGHRAISAVQTWCDVCRRDCPSETRINANTRLLHVRQGFAALLNEIGDRFPTEDAFAARKQFEEDHQKFEKSFSTTLQQVTDACKMMEELGALRCGPTSQDCKDELQELRKLMEEWRQLQSNRSGLLVMRQTSPTIRRRTEEELELEINKVDDYITKHKESVREIFFMLEKDVPSWFPEHLADFYECSGGSLLLHFDPVETLQKYEKIPSPQPRTRNPVFRATNSGRDVVVKQFVDLAVAQQECRVVKRVHSEKRAPCNFVVEIIKTFVDSGMYFSVMPHYSGGHINAWLRPRLRATDGSGAEALLRVMAQVAEGVAALHDVGIVHSDLKWENVVMSSQDDAAIPKIIDFDVSATLEQRTTAVIRALTQTMHVYGTPDWFAPEIARGAKELSEEELLHLVNFPIDVYALGLLLMRLIGPDKLPAVSWTLPCHNDSPTAVGVSVAALRRLASVQEPLEALANEMLCDDPQGRPEATAVHEAFNAMLQDLKTRD